MTTHVCKERKNKPRMTREMCERHIRRGNRVCLKKENIRGLKQLRCEIAWEILNS